MKKINGLWNDSIIIWDITNQILVLVVLDVIYNAVMRIMNTLNSQNNLKLQNYNS